MQKTIIIIPCFNEENRLTIDEYEKGFKENEDVLFVFVNDGSTDNTLSLLNDLVKKNSNVEVLDLKKNSGKANAIQFAVKEISVKKEFQFLGFFDADLATPLNEIKSFLKTFESNPDLQMVTGARIRRMGTEIKRNMFRHVIGRIFATFASLTILLPVYDTQCGAKIFKKDILHILFEDPFISKWLFDVEIFARLTLYNGFPKIYKTIYELPISKWDDKKGSKISFFSFFTFPIDLYRIFKKYNFKIKKLHQR